MAEQSSCPISKILAEAIKDSRGNPTIKVTVFATGKTSSFAVPSGASTGTHEAHVIDNNQAILNVNDKISKALMGQDVFNQKEIDRIMLELDGTANKDNFGGNALIGVSIACAKCAAKVRGLEVFEYLRTLAEIKPSRKSPYLFMNLIEGGKHAKNKLAFQEYMVVPDTEDEAEALQLGIEIDNLLKDVIRLSLGYDSLISGDEGGFDPQTDDIRKPLELLTKVIKENNLQDKVRLALDVAASSFYQDGIYKIGGKNVSKDELMNLYQSLITEFNIFSIEDPFDEEDFESFKNLKSGERELKVVGDDLTVTNKMLLQKAIDSRSINAMIIKPNQIGTLTETLETMQLARENNIELIVSHRSGETEDDFIADLAYAFGCFGLKSGAPLKPERMVKYNRLINISNGK